MIEIVRNSGADIICMSETYGAAASLAKALGYHYYTPSAGANLAIFSRWPMEDIGTLKGLSSFSFISATVLHPSVISFRIYAIWITSSGRHIVAIKDQNIDDATFVSGDLVRNKHLQQLTRHPRFLMDVAASNETPLIVAGDFNCVSHLDYTYETIALGLNYNRYLPIDVSLTMQEMGFTDSYRFIHPVVSKDTLGYTWTTVSKDFTYDGKQRKFISVPIEKNPQPQNQDLYARIDYIYHHGNRITPISSKVISHYSPSDTNMFPKWPSDHAAVITKYQLFINNKAGTSN